MSHGQNPEKCWGVGTWNPEQIAGDVEESRRRQNPEPPESIAGRIKRILRNLSREPSPKSSVAKPPAPAAPPSPRPAEHARKPQRSSEGEEALALGAPRDIALREQTHVLSDYLHEMTQMLQSLDKAAPRREGLAAGVTRLQRAGVLPRKIAKVMRGSIPCGSR